MGYPRVSREAASRMINLHAAQFSTTARTAITGALFAVLATLFVTAAGARPLDDVVESKVLKIVVYEDNAPFSWSVDGVAKGIDVDFGKALARELGVEAEFIVRMLGEEVDDDLRANIWRGPLTGGGVGDVMLHVPTDRELAMRNKEAVIGNPYFLETIALAVHPDRVPKDATFDHFKTEKVGVKLGTVSDYFLMTFEKGALINNVAHHLKGSKGVAEFLSGETAALMGVRSEIEGNFHDAGKSAHFISPPMEGIFRTQWVVGTAVDEKSRDLSYALGAAIEKLRSSGEMTKIFSKYGVTFLPPPES